MQTMYAGFWRRLAAFVVDTGITGFLFVAFTFTSLVLINTVGRIITAPFVFSPDFSPEAYGEAYLETFSMAYGIAAAIALVVPGWLYYSLFERSPLRATPGKLLVGIQLTDLNGERIGFGKSTYRLLIKTVVLWLWILVPFGLLVLVPLLVWLACWLSVLSSERKQALYDIPAGTVVVRKGAFTARQESDEAENEDTVKQQDG